MQLSFSTTAFLLLGAVQGVLSDHVKVTGAPASSDGSVPVRRSITQLQEEAGPQWDLYIQSLQEMYDADSSDPLSQFQIAGIHGRPFVEWNNTGRSTTNGWGGYSTHGEPLFLTWHRPFVALFEQTLVSHAKRLAQGYPAEQRDTYVQAADQLRVPYWDWSLEPHVPQATVPQTVTINKASSGSVAQTKVNNPLYAFSYPKEALDSVYGLFDRTRLDLPIRCSAPNSYPFSASRNIASRPYKEWTYDIFTRSSNFNEFATTSSSGMSLESIHNSVHWDAGCGGQFLNAEYSAFEPLFMLHHANVDRLWAYWQALRPDSTTFDYEYRGLPRFSSPGGNMISVNSPLQPFLQPDGSWHTSKSVDSIRTFGYTYEGLEYWKKSTEDMKRDTAQIINNLYGPESQNSKKPTATPSATKAPSSTTKTPSSAKGTSSAATASPSSVDSKSPSSVSNTPSSVSNSPSSVSKTPSSVGNDTPSPVDTKTPSSTDNNKPPSNDNNTPTVDQDTIRFFANISIDVTQLPERPCAIGIFVGGRPAGSMVIMKQPSEGILHDGFPLDHAIRTSGLNRGISVDEILAKVKANLKVVISRVDGTTISTDKVPSLKVDLEQSRVTPATSEFDLPTHSQTELVSGFKGGVAGCPAPVRKQ